MSQITSDEKWILVDSATGARVGSSTYPSQEEANRVKAQKLTEAEQRGGPKPQLEARQILTEG